MYLDLDNNKLYFAKNGTLENSGTGVSITAPSSLANQGYFPAAGYFDGDGSSTHQGGGGYPKIVDKDIKNRIQKAVDEYVKMYGLQSVSVKMIWSNIQNVGSRLIEHRHPGSIVSGALYINVGDESKLYFHNPNPYIYYSQYAERTDYNYEFQWLKVENGQLVLFPSWLKHGKYSEIIKMDGRMVVSFNCE